MDLLITPNAASEAYNIQELTWDQVKKDFLKSNKELFDIIESLDPGEKLTFIKARYPYGATIIDNGVTYLPHKSGASIPIKDALVAPDIKEKLSYSPIPLALPINKANEVFIRIGGRVVPLRLIMPNNLFGLFEVVNKLSGLKADPIWCVSSGARSIFMLPKITNKLGYQQLKKELNISLTAPTFLDDHWEVFKQLSNHQSFVNNWHNDILFFTDAWFNKSFNSGRWGDFYNYLYKVSNIVSQATRDERVINITWQCISLAIGNRNLRPRPYLTDTAKHLFSLALGIFPGFQPCDQSQVAAPTQLLQELYTQTYGLKEHLPTIMNLHNLDAENETRPVYYSLNFPFFLEGAPPHKAYHDVIADLRDLKLLTDTLFNALNEGKIPLPKVHTLLKNVQYDYFHNVKDIYREIKTIPEMVAEDPFLVADKELLKNREFCLTAPFLSGCIRVSPKQAFVGKK